MEALIPGVATPKGHASFVLRPAEDLVVQPLGRRKRVVEVSVAGRANERPIEGPLIARPHSGLVQASWSNKCRRARREATVTNGTFLA